MLETEINILVDEFVFNHGYNPVEHIKSRIKSEKSIKNKLKDKGYDYTLTNIKKISMMSLVLELLFLF